jgi:hypothetical protein
MKVDVLGGLHKYRSRFSRILLRKPKRYGGLDKGIISDFPLGDEKLASYSLNRVQMVVPYQETSRPTFAYPKRQPSVRDMPTNQVLFVVNPDTACTPQPALNQFPKSFHPAQRVSDLSSLSSLSSGFGDAKIDVPESGPTTMDVQPKSLDNYSTSSISVNRLSWELSQHPQPPIPQQSWQLDTHFTVNTVMSEGSPPRFRSVSSWVNQQTIQIERQRAAHGVSIPKAARQSQHERVRSGATDSVFEYYSEQNVPNPEHR